MWNSSTSGRRSTGSAVSRSMEESVDCSAASEGAVATNHRLMRFSRS
jgi:hypothetical protein